MKTGLRNRTAQREKTDSFEVYLNEGGFICSALKTTYTTVTIESDIGS